MPIPLGILAAAGASAGPTPLGPTFELISSTILSATGSTTIEFTSVPATFKHLQIRISARTTANVGSWDVYLRFNGDSGSNYRKANLYRSSSTVATDNGGGSANQILLQDIAAGNSATANVFLGGIYTIYNYRETTRAKNVSGWSGGFAQPWWNTGVWTSTNAITTVSCIIPSGGGNFASGTRISLYGIKG